ncbi:MAG: GNAT family N-acetyltransferase [Bifidobacteriaceae bacterium]|nr:GNAT family N-acetyltransferase [Bifidobacteriaceae bacterium]
MAWARLFGADAPGYGFADGLTPEIAIAVLPEQRGQGLGSELLAALFRELRARGWGRVSLSCDKTNPALRLYRRLGFATVADGGEDLIMVKALDGRGLSHAGN